MPKFDNLRGRCSYLLALAAFALASHASAATDAPPPANILVDNSYIVTFKPSTQSQPSLILPPPATRPATPPPFGENSTGQSKQALAATLGIRGQVVSIFEAINAAHLRIDAAEAERLRTDPRVLRVEQNMIATTASVQVNPGWGLDRLDQTTTALDGQYIYNSDGTGRTIYILDTGLDLSYPAVAAEFGGRATVFWDVNGAGGLDCYGHGTQVASAAAGNTRGVAKGANVIVAKITTGCGNTATSDTFVLAFNWLAVNAPKGTIANLSFAYTNGLHSCSGAITVQAVEDAIRAAYNAGIISVVAAGNDGCDTANYTPTRIPEAFVVGATDMSRFPFSQDSRMVDSVNGLESRFGANVSTFAPGKDVALIYFNGASVLNSGTSFAAPYIAGMFAVGCQASGTLCDTMANAGVAYDALRNIGTIGTVVNSDGSALPGGTVSRFISRSPW